MAATTSETDGFGVYDLVIAMEYAPHLQAISAAMGQVVEEGYAHVDEAGVPNGTRRNFNTETASFNFYWPDEAHRGNGSSRAIRFEPQTRLERKHLSAQQMPWLRYYAAQLGKTISAFGDREAITTLQGWRPNNATINRLQPMAAKKGQLYRHTDPERHSGVVAVVALSEVETTAWARSADRLVPITTVLRAGSLSLFAAADTANNLGIEQVEYGIASDDEAFILSFQFSPDLPPIGFRSLVRRMSHR